MGAADLLAVLPLILIAATSIAVMLAIAFYRKHWIAAFITLAGLAVSFASIFVADPYTPRNVTGLLVIDGYALFFIGLIFAGTFTVALLAYGYLEQKENAGMEREEFYLLLLLAASGGGVLAASSHFASFFLGLETLSVSLYALISYTRDSEKAVEAGVKYLILAAVSSAFLLFGMALIYARLGTMEFSAIAAMAPGAYAMKDPVFLGALALIAAGIGFKLAVAPFHMWTPDVYEGAPAPVAAFVATVSKGAVFALFLRYFASVDIHQSSSLMLAVAVISIGSMFIGNLLALLQDNVKRILAYSSIAHLGYLLVAFLAAGALRATAVAYYLVSYFITMLGAFGVVTVLSGKRRAGGQGEFEDLQDYRGLAASRPVIAAVFTAMLFSLAGMPLTAGFIGKFYVMAAGAGSALWALIIALAVNSAIGLFYYVRVIVAMYSKEEAGFSGGGKVEGIPVPAAAAAVISGAAIPLGDGLVLAGLTLALVWFGVYPPTLLHIIQKALHGLM